MLPFEGGRETSAAELADRARESADRDGVEGITILGGEPFAQASGAAELARLVRASGLSVMVFSGFTIEEIRASTYPAYRDLLDRTDLLVDGPYLRDRPETRRRWIGSANQRIHALSTRYRVDDPRWQRPNTLEIRLEGPVVTVNGFPSPSAVGIWRRIGGGSGGKP
jgi:anaerobic ribonucleoside-triphosphate reductase activating protein